jgi:signal transduction histidine kinase
MVSLSYHGDATHLVVTDDGKGLDLNSLDNGSRLGQGVANMQERARLLGGELVLDSEPGRGMRLLLAIPCAGRRDGQPELVEQSTWD